MRAGMTTPLARKATSLIISLRLNLRNKGDDAQYCVVSSVEPEATPSANNVILHCARKPETCVNYVERATPPYSYEERAVFATFSTIARAVSMLSTSG